MCRCAQIAHARRLLQGVLRPVLLAHSIACLAWSQCIFYSNGELAGPECLTKLLGQLAPLLARDFAPGFRAAFWADAKVVALLRRNNTALRSLWAARSWYPHGASLAMIEADMLDRGLICDNYSVGLHDASGCFLSLSIEQVKEAFVDSLDLSIGARAAHMRPHSHCVSRGLVLLARRWSVCVAQSAT